MYLVAGAEAFIQVFRTAADVFVGFTAGIFNCGCVLD